MMNKDLKDKYRQKKRIVGFQIIEDECIWMKAGIVNFRLCDNAYDCYNCPFDKGMQRSMGSGDKIERKKKEPGFKNPLSRGGTTLPLCINRTD